MPLSANFPLPFRRRVEIFGGWRDSRHPENIMSKPSKEFLSAKTLLAPGPAGYSHIVKVNSGTIVYLSGQVSSDASGKVIGEGDFEAQVEQVFGNLKIAVEAAGGVMADLVKLNYYLVAEVEQSDVPKLRRYATVTSTSRNRRQARSLLSAA
jgi:enamine deaminase RidA (YjgF/YER057c/UK114 family)